MNSRAKGASAEREVASILKAEGYEARRGQQYSGANGDADVVGLPGVHIEVKRRERFDLYGSLKQSIHDAREGETPVVFHRKNRETWVAIMTLSDYLNLYRRAQHD